MQNKTNAKKNPRRKRNNGNGSNAITLPGRQAELERLSAARMPRGFIRISPFPPEVTVRCTYQAAVELFSGVNAYNVKDFTINNVRLPDPTLTDTANGYSFYSQVYRLFRVTHCEVDYIITNVDGIAASAAFVCNDTQPSTLIASYNQAKAFATSGYSTGPALVGVDTGNSTSVRKRYRIALGDVVGDNLAYMGQPGFAGSDTASPTQSVWGSFVGFTVDAVTPFPNGLAIQATFIMTTRFYSLRPV